jgi:regulator of sigma E protease
VAIRVTPEKRDGAPGGEPHYVIGFVPTERVVGEVEEGSRAHKAGLRQWAFIVRDVIESPDGKKAEISWRNPDGTKGSAILPVNGEGPELVVATVKREPLPAESFLSAWATGAVECAGSLRVMVNMLYGPVSRRVPAGETAGILGIAQVTYYSTKYGLGYHLWLVAFISINLAVINLVPMMPLDGGLLAFLFYEAVRGRPASRRVQEAAQIAGFVLIVALIVLVTRNDIVRMF